MKKNERKTNKKLVLWSVLTLVFILIIGFFGFRILRGAENSEAGSENKIILDSSLKNTDGKQIEISKEVPEEEVVSYFENLVNSKKSFVIYVSLPICSGEAAKFKEYVLEFQKENKISFYYLTSDYIKDTSLYKTVKYFPSVITYSDGEIQNYLRYDSDEDAEFYKSYDGFSKWFKKNVEI